MAQQYNTGAAYLYLAGFNEVPGNAKFLGTAEESPDIDIRTLYAGSRASQGGVAKDFDRANQGQEAIVSFTLTRWNEIILLAAIDQPNAALSLAGAAASAPGTYLPGDVGTMMMLEGEALTLFVLFPYAAKPAMLAGGGLSGIGGPLRPGYRFPVANLVSENYPRNGTMPMAVTMVYECSSFFNATAGANPFGVGTFTLYDFNVAGLPLPN